MITVPYFDDIKNDIQKSHRAVFFYLPVIIAVLLLMFLANAAFLYFKGDINFARLFNVFVTLGVYSFTVFCAFFLAYKMQDYRKWMYLGMSIPFSVITYAVILMTLKKGNYDQVLAIGFVLLTAISGTAVILRAIDYWLKGQGITIKTETHKKEPQCQAVPLNLSTPSKKLQH